MPSPESDGLTAGTLLGGRVRLTQPATGYRAAIDPVLLAAAVSAQAGERVLDAGLGAGAAILCLAARTKGLDLTGLEIDPEMAALAARNAADNGVTLAIATGDVAALPAPFGAEVFDHILSNPPYHAADTTPPPDAAKARAHVETLPLGDWIGFCLRALKQGGALTLVLPAARLDDALAQLARGCGHVAVMPLWPRAGGEAKRVLVRARKATRGPARLLPGLVLHGADGRYTPEAEAILRDGAALPFDPPALPRPPRPPTTPA